MARGIRSRRSSQWRRIVVDEVPHKWSIVVRRTPLDAEALSNDLEVVLRVRSADRRLVAEATFHGHMAETWAYKWQSLSIRPATVAAVVRHALREGPRLDHAEAVFPGAIVPGDLADEALRAACAKWFVPFPGRPPT